MPTVATSGSPLRSGAMSEPLVAITAVAVLLVSVPSLVAPVVPANVLEPGAVGVPDTVQMILPFGRTLAVGVGEQDVVRPAGRPVTPQAAAVAVTSGAPPFVQVNVPL